MYMQNLFVKPMLDISLMMWSSNSLEVISLLNLYSVKFQSNWQIPAGGRSNSLKQMDLIWREYLLGEFEKANAYRGSNTYLTYFIGHRHKWNMEGIVFHHLGSRIG